MDAISQSEENLVLTQEETDILEQCWDHEKMGLSAEDVLSMSHREYLEFCKKYVKSQKITKSNNHWFYSMNREELEEALLKINLNAVKEMIDEMNWTESSESMTRYNDNIVRRLAYGQLDIPDDLSLEDLKKLPKYDKENQRFYGSKRKMRSLINIFFMPINGKRTHRNSTRKF